MDSNIDVGNPSSAHRLRAELFAEVLRSGGTVSLRVFGGSMWPGLRSGDLLEIRRDVPARIRPGDIVLFHRDRRLFAHRVIRKLLRNGRPVLVTKGDALPRSDGPLAEEELLGRVFSVRRGPRKIPLDSPSRRALARAAALFTYSSRFWYPLARAVRRLTRP